MAKIEQDACRVLVHPERTERDDWATLYSQCPLRAAKASYRCNLAVSGGSGLHLPLIGHESQKFRSKMI